MNNTFAYIESLGGDGWLRVKFDDGLTWPLPEYLQVMVTKSGERESFKVLEGRFKGRTATVKKKGWKWDDWDGSYFEEEVHLLDNCVHKSAASMTFHVRLGGLEVKGFGVVDAITDPSNPIPNGTYDIEIPYEPHPSNSRYAADANYYKTWFRVGHSGDRFLHCGQVSAGCITVTDIKKWDELYKYLILCRKGFDSIGTVKVKI